MKTNSQMAQMLKLADKDFTQWIDLPALLLGMFIILYLTPNLLPTSRNRKSIHSGEVGEGPRVLSSEDLESQAR